MDMNYHDIYHFILLFNHQQEPILSIYDDYTLKILINPHQNSYYDGNSSISIPNILMQVFSPVLATQSGMQDTLKMRFHKIVLVNDKVLIIHKIQYCTLFVLLSENCNFRHLNHIINKKLDLIEWVLSSFFGVCWNHMKLTSDKWIRVMLKELWLMDDLEFNLKFNSVERLDFMNNEKLTDKVIEVLAANSRYMKQINERKIKHQLILTGSKLYTLYSTDLSHSLKSKHILLFVLICNAVFNRFSRMRESFYELNDHRDSLNNRKSSLTDFESSDNINSDNAGSNIDLSKTIQLNKDLNGFRKSNTASSTISSLSDLDYFVLWVENKDGYKYRIVRIFLNFNTTFLSPCNLHLVKLSRNVIYLGVEEDLENSILIANLDKSIRLLRRIVNDQTQHKDAVPILRGRICQAIEKLIYLGVLYSQKLRTIFKQIMREINNYDTLERLLKELLRHLEAVYVEYYLSPQIKVQERLCKCFLRCFIVVRRSINDFVSILSVKAMRHLPMTSLYSIYPGLIHFVISVRRIENYIISPVLDGDFISENTVRRIHLLVDIMRKLAAQCDDANSQQWTWRQMDMISRPRQLLSHAALQSSTESHLMSNCDLHASYLRRRLKNQHDDVITEFEMVMIHSLADSNTNVIRKQMVTMTNQFLSDLTQPEINLLSLIS